MRRFGQLICLAAVAAAVLHSAWLAVERSRVARTLSRAESAAATVDYHGRQELRLSGAGPAVTMTVAVVHQAPGKTRMEYLDGELAGTVVVKDGARQWRHDPRLGMTCELDASAAAPLSMAGYRASQRAGEPVAGRASDRVSLRRRGLERSLWLDRATGLVLRQVVVRGGQTADTRFTDFTVGRPDRPVTFTAPPGRLVRLAEAMSVAECSRQVGFAVPLPADVPAGYRRVGCYVYDCPCGCGMRSAHLLYSDGVGWISVFAQDAAHAGCVVSQECCGLGREAKACVGGSKKGVNLVVRTDRDPMLVALGDVSRADLARMLDSTP